ncbi:MULTISPECIES: hypothetical protein [Bacillus cereus group]|uniref:hypothetical protein n=1 Tax=Bacillus cereus group TaxID=86661 RepID=UPI000D96752C|nr:hypothetical protein [Bacillus cereus]MCU4948963.1 hypothetical protein [Bacillus cereus]SPT76117.1 Uncharacterised protein [Bacillus cereus]
MSVYSKIVLSNGNEYIVPIQPSTLLEKELVNKEGEIYNKFIYVQQINVETGKKMNIALNPQHIAVIEEMSVVKYQNIPSVFIVEKNSGLEYK